MGPYQALGGHLGFWPLEAKPTIFASVNISNIHKDIIRDMKMHKNLNRLGGAAMVDLPAAL